MTKESASSTNGLALRRLHPADDALPWPVTSVEVVNLDLLDAALLHRDSPAERGRLVTRGFIAGSLKQWFTVDDSQPTVEVLCAQTIAYRFRSPADATLSEADGWSELHAGGARFVERFVERFGERFGEHEPRPLRIATLIEESHTHALSYQRENDIVRAVFATHINADAAIDAASRLLASRQP